MDQIMLGKKTICNWTDLIVMPTVSIHAVETAKSGKLLFGVAPLR